MKALGGVVVIVAIWGCGDDATTIPTVGNVIADASAEGGGGGSSGTVSSGGAGGANGGSAAGGMSSGGVPDAAIPLAECDGSIGSLDGGCSDPLQDPWAGMCDETDPTDAGSFDDGGTEDGGFLDDAGLVSVAGQWCGVPARAVCSGDETGYLVAEQTGHTVVGQFCEREGVDCYDIQCGTMQGSELTFYYAFLEEDVWYRVDGAFTASTSGQQLLGTLLSSKCMCTLNRTLHRM